MTTRLLFDRLVQALTPLHGSGEARSMALYLLEIKTGLPRSQVLSGSGVRPTLAAEADEWLSRLLRHEPVQYVLGEAEFSGRMFAVTPAVLIPRPETEELVAWVLENQRLRYLVTPRLLDIGTGSGCIGISVAAAWPHAEVWAVDVSEEALAVARQNAERHGVKLQFFCLDFLKGAFPDAFPMQFDAVLSNPPYVTPAEKTAMNPNVLAYEPHTALFVPAADPLLFYRHIAAFCAGRLAETGNYYVEINETLATQTLRMFRQHGLHATLRSDLLGRPRMVAGGKLADFPM